MRMTEGNVVDTLYFSPDSKLQLSHPQSPPQFLHVSPLLFPAFSVLSSVPTSCHQTAGFPPWKVNEGEGRGHRWEEGKVIAAFTVGLQNFALTQVHLKGIVNCLMFLGKCGGVISWCVVVVWFEGHWSICVGWICCKISHRQIYEASLVTDHRSALGECCLIVELWAPFWIHGYTFLFLPCF